MKVAVVGCGAVGSYYGACLARAGQEVHFLLRSDYEAVRRSGVLIRSPRGDFRVRPRCALDPKEIGVSDLVLIGLKTTANDRFESLLPPLVGPGTALLTLQNGLGNEESLARHFPEDQILGGLCFVCLNRTAPGVVEHMAHGLIVLGEHNRWPEPRTHNLAEHFRKGGVPCKVTDSLARAHWEKLVWNIPFNGLGVASAAGFQAVDSGCWKGGELQPCLATDRLLADAQWTLIVTELMREVVAAARAQGWELSDAIIEEQISRTRSMGPYKASTLLDFEQGRPTELESLFGEPLRQARAARVRVPRLEKLCAVLRQLDGTRRAA